MAASTALHDIKPSSWIDLSRSTDYPVLLGESLKKSSDPRTGPIDIRYNWTAPSISQTKSVRRTLTRPKGRYKLSIQDDRDSPSSLYTYSGAVRGEHSPDPVPRPNSFALIFDQSKSAFTLESVSNAFDFTLESGTNYSEDEVENMPQFPPEIPSDLHVEPSKSKKAVFNRSDSEDESPDASNPFDYRHFLSEARENNEKVQAPTGARTPLPGSRTPLSAAASPALTSTRFVSSKQLPPAGSSLREKKKPTTTASHSRNSPKSTKLDGRRGSQKSHTKVLSKERISDSDEEISDSSVVRAPSPVQLQPPASAQRQRQDKTSSSTTASDRTTARLRGDSAASASNMGRSPQIVIDDVLEIDLGSPPRESQPRRHGRVDPQAFRSHTGTPLMGRSTNVSPIRGLQRSIFTREHGNDHDHDIKMGDASDGEEDERWRRRSHHEVEEIDLPSGGRDDSDDDINEDDNDHTHRRENNPRDQINDDEDDDVEKFILPSPRANTSTKPTPTNKPSRITTQSHDQRSTRARIPSQTNSFRQDNRRDSSPMEDSAPTPPAPNNNADTGDDDELEAALEAAFDDVDEDEDSRGNGSGYGLGIKNGPGGRNVDEDESEVSEEE